MNWIGGGLATMLVVAMLQVMIRRHQRGPIVVYRAQASWVPAARVLSAALLVVALVALVVGGLGGVTRGWP